ncbi:MAG TPA: ATP-binding protein [Polyangiaceae bacterium]|nr:ATP-binding protein [Polyangiaceae bacterium]
MRNPKTRLSERLARSNREALFGRERELALLEAQLAPEGAVVTFVHGAGGIGKTSLLAAAMPRLEELGALVVTLDARSIAPTARAFLAAVRAKVGVEPFGVHDLQEEIRDAEDIRALAQVLEREPAPHAFLVDEFDNLRLLDDWLRREFLPELPERTRWVFAGRFGPRAAWLTTPGWSRAVVSLKLEPLDEAAARTLLLARGVPEEEVARLTRLARGTPLALTLVTAKSEAEPTVNENAVLAALAERSVQALPLALREALEAASVVRRVTRDMLVELLGAAYDESLLDELSQLSFVEHAEDGLVLHETVRHAVASRLRALDPSRHQRLRQSASAVIARALDSQPKPRSGAWRLLADMLFLSDEPGLREAFFPTRDNGAAVMDAALASDHAPLRALVERNDEGPWLEVFEAWWQHAPKCFRVVRGSHGALLGFSLVVPSGDIPRALTSEDPLLGTWQADLAASPGGERGALFMRRALAAQGETEEATRSLIWLDVKRSYVERPEQWALYVATREAERRALRPCASRVSTRGARARG